MIQIERQLSSDVRQSKPDVLLLETRQELCMLLKLYLERLGFRALCANSSEEALKLWVENKKTLSLFLSDWSQTHGLTPRDLVALFRIGKPSVRVINTAPFVNFSYPAHEFSGQQKAVGAPRSLEAFRVILLDETTPSKVSGFDCSPQPVEELVVTSS